jgi:hypothetical protein
VRGRLALVAVLLVVVLGGPTGHAAASTPDQQGWWTALRAGVGPNTLLAPDVPSHGLLVQGGESGPTAYAALVYASVPDGPVSLKLAAASGAISTPNATLVACPLREAHIQPAEGGPMSDAPAYDCTTSVPDTIDGADHRFDVSSLVAGGALAVAILATGPTDRVVFDAPDAGSLAAAPADTSLLPGSAFDGGAFPAPFDTGASTYPALPSPPVAAPAPPAAVVSRAATLPAPVLPIAGTVEGAEPAAVVTVLLVTLLGVALWLAPRRAAARAIHAN